MNAFDAKSTKSEDQGAETFPGFANEVKIKEENLSDAETFTDFTSEVKVKEEILSEAETFPVFSSEVKVKEENISDPFQEPESISLPFGFDDKIKKENEETEGHGDVKFTVTGKDGLTVLKSEEITVHQIVPAKWRKEILLSIYKEQFSIDSQDFKSIHEELPNSSSSSSCEEISESNRHFDIVRNRAINKEVPIQRAQRLPQIANEEHNQPEIPKGEKTASFRIRGEIRKQYCIFCDRLVSKLPRHLLQMHKEEEDVRQISELPLKSSARMQMLEKLRKAGTAKYNSSVLKSDVLVAKRSNAGHYCPFCGHLYAYLSSHLAKAHTTEEQVMKLFSFEPNSRDRRICMQTICEQGDKLFGSKHIIKPRIDVACPSCKQMYSKLTLYRHYKSCSKGIKSRSLQSESRKLQLQKELRDVCPKLLNIVSKMREDNVREAILNDNLLRYVGSKWTDMYKVPEHYSYVHISNHLRQLARLLLSARKISSDISELSDLLKAQFYDTFKNAAMILGRFNAETNSYDSPTVPTNIGFLMHRISKLYIIKLRSENNEKTVDEVCMWQMKYQSDFSASVGFSSLKCTQKKKWQKPKLMSLTKDIQKLNLFLSKLINESITSLNQCFTYKTWSTLTKATLVKMVIFNGKGRGECGKLLIDDYLQKTEILKDSKEYKQLNNVEKLLWKKFKRMSFCGKNRKPTSCLLNEQVIRAIDIIIRFRKDAGVDKKNIYLFGIGSMGHFWARRTLKELATTAKIGNQDNFRGYRLQKHIAFISLAMDLTENDFNILTDFVGNRMSAPRNFDYQATNVLHLAKMLRLLLAIEDGNYSEYVGKRLTDINVDLCIEDENSGLTTTDDTIHAKEGKFETEARIQESSGLLGTNISISDQKIINGQPQEQLLKSNLTPFNTPTKDTAKNMRLKKRRKRLQKKAVMNLFSSYITRKSLPSLRTCEVAIIKSAALHSRTPSQIKSLIKNLIKKK